MTDERVRLVQKVNGMTEIRVLATVVHAEGSLWLYNELSARGLAATDLGEPQVLRSHPAEWRIPVRRTQ